MKIITLSIPIVRDLVFGDVNSIISVYQDAFAGPPWYENWNNEDVFSLILEAYANKGFIGTIVEDQSSTLGFGFGYEVPNVNTKTVAFSKIKNMLYDIGWQNSIYLAECGVLQSIQNKGFGGGLISKLREDAPELVFRTMNSIMVKVIEKQYDQKVQELFYDPVKTDRVWYGVRLK